MPTSSISIHAVDGSPLRTASHHGREYFGGELGQRYRIRVKNNTAGRIGVVCTVDGRNVLDNSPGEYAGQLMIIRQYSTYDFEGWRTSNETVAAFRLSEGETSYAARTGDASNVGVIGLAVFAEKAQPRSKHLFLGAQGVTRGVGGSSTSRGAGTGFGESVSSAVTTTQFEPATALPAEVHVVFYDTVTNLVAAGILPREGGPNPFPANVGPMQRFCQAPV